MDSIEMCTSSVAVIFIHAKGVRVETKVFTCQTNSLDNFSD